MIIFFDTETTGKPKRYGAPVSEVDIHPRLVQLGFVVYSGNFVVDEKEDIIMPEGFSVPQEASNIHGVTQEIAVEKGVPIRYALREFCSWLFQCDIVAGHNTPFDIGVVGAEFWRLYAADPFEGKAIADTMRSGTQFCRLPGGYNGKYKYPKLSELYQKLFGEEMGVAHTALQDIRNTAKCYFEMEKRGLTNG